MILADLLSREIFCIGVCTGPLRCYSFKYDRFIYLGIFFQLFKSSQFYYVIVSWVVVVFKDNAVPGIGPVLNLFSAKSLGQILVQVFLYHIQD